MAKSVLESLEAVWMKLVKGFIEDIGSDQGLWYNVGKLYTVCKATDYSSFRFSFRCSFDFYFFRTQIYSFKYKSNFLCESEI